MVIAMVERKPANRRDLVIIGTRECEKPVAIIIVQLRFTVEAKTLKERRPLVNTKGV